MTVSLCQEGKQKAFTVVSLRPSVRYTDCYLVRVAGQAQRLLIHEEGLKVASAKSGERWQKYMEPSREQARQ